MADDSVKLLLGLLIIVTLAIQTDTDTMRNVLNTMAPDSLVKLGVDTDILGSHQLLNEALDSLDGGGGALLEGPTIRKGYKQDERREMLILSVDVFVQVDGALTADNLGGDGALGTSLRSLSHLERNGWISFRVEIHQDGSYLTFPVTD